VGSAFENAREKLSDSAALEGSPAGEEVVESRSDGVDVGADVDRIAANLLRRREGGGAEEGPGLRQMALDGGDRRERKPVVSNLHSAALRDEAVGRLDVAVKNASGGGRLKTIDDLQDCIDGFAGRHGTVPFDPVLERPALDQLHRDRGGSLDLLGAENVNAVGVAYGGGKSALAEEAGMVGRVGDSAAQDLERDAAAGLF